jgi:hypothetical protein
MEGPPLEGATWLAERHYLGGDDQPVTVDPMRLRERWVTDDDGYRHKTTQERSRKIDHEAMMMSQSWFVPQQGSGQSQRGWAVCSVCTVRLVTHRASASCHQSHNLFIMGRSLTNHKGILSTRCARQNGANHIGSLTLVAIRANFLARSR